MENSLRAALSQLDRYGSEQNRESLQFLTRAFATVVEQETLARSVDCITTEVYNLLCPRISASKAVPVLQRMLITARYDQERVSALSSHTDCYSHSMSVTVSDLLAKLSFYELLLVISYKIDTYPKGCVVLKHMVGAAEPEKVGASKEDVKTALQLFTCMLATDTLASSKPYSVVSELRELWSGVSSKDERVKMVIDDIEDVVARNVTQVGESGIWIINFHIEDDIKIFPESTWCQRNICAAILTVALLVFLTISLTNLTVLLGTCDPLSSDSAFHVHMQDFTSWTGATFWGFDMPLHTSRYSGFHLRVEQPSPDLDSPVPYTINTTTIPCSAQNKPTVTTVTSSANHNLSNCNAIQYWRKKACKVSFVEGAHTLQSSSPYVLKGSSFNITLLTRDLPDDAVVNLYLFTDVQTCVDGIFPLDPEEMFNGAPYNLSRAGNSSVYIRAKENGFYCGFFNSSVALSFNYTIHTQILGYNFTSLSTSATSTFTSTDLDLAKTKTFDLQHYPSEVCLLVDLVNDQSGWLNITLTPVRVTVLGCMEINVRFGLIFGLFLLPALIILCLLCGYCWYKKAVATHEGYAPLA